MYVSYSRDTVSQVGLTNQPEIGSVHVKVDTGLSRFGCKPCELSLLIEVSYHKSFHHPIQSQADVFCLFPYGYINLALLTTGSIIPANPDIHLILGWDLSVRLNLRMI